MPVIGSEPLGLTRGRRFRVHLASACAALFGVLVYLNALQNPYVYDDFRLIVENPSLARPWDLGLVVMRDIARPLVNLSYAIDTLLWGRTRFGYHATSVLLHGINVVLVFWVVFSAIVDRRRSASDASSVRRSPGVAAFAASVVFAVHPLMTEAVGYISGRSEVLYSAFFLLAFLAGRRWMTGGGTRWRAACVGLWLAGMLSKESAAMLPAVLLAYDRLVLAGDVDTHRRHWRGLLLPMFAAALLIGIGRIALLQFVEYPGFRGIGWPLALLQIDVFWRYVGIFLLPRDQSIFHAVPLINSPFAPRALAGVLGLVSFLGLAWALRRRHGLVAFGLLWFPIILVPSAMLFALGRGEAMAEHRAYLPAAGLFLLWGCAVDVMWARGGLQRILVGATAVILVMTLGFLTIVRNMIWQDPVTLTQEAVRLAPRYWVPRVLAGDALRQSERCAEAIIEYRIAVEIRPLNELPYTSLARCLMFEQRLDETEDVLRQLRTLNPASQDASMGLGLVALLRGRSDESRGYFVETRGRSPGHPRAHTLLAFVDGALPPDKYRRVCEDLHAMTGGGLAIDACRIGTGSDGESGVQRW